MMPERNESELLHTIAQEFAQLAKDLDITVVTPSTIVNEMFFVPKTITMDDICGSDELNNIVEFTI